jgi:hypothetical protein
MNGMRMVSDFEDEVYFAYTTKASVREKTWMDSFLLGWTAFS